jgi:hypothetical protein
MVFSHAIDTLAKRGGVSVGKSGKNITNVQQMWQFCSCISKSGISRCVNCKDGKKLYHPIIVHPFRVRSSTTPFELALAAIDF